MSYQLGQVLYKIDSKNKVRNWKIEVIDDGKKATIVTTSGLVGGKKVVNKIEVSAGKNIGKSNETTYYEQAVSEALATAELKLRGEYKADVADAEQQTLRSGIKAPMLAQKYCADGSQHGSKTLKQMKIEGQSIYVQPKLDGNRCLIHIKDELNITMYTRKGDVMPVQITGILDEIKVAARNHSIINTTLDGELFCPDMTFNELNGHLKRQDSQDLLALDKIKYHLYDVMNSDRYVHRFEFLKKFDSNKVEVLPSYCIKATDAEIAHYLERFLSEGHEGLMIRRLDMPYENKRSWQLCKVKVFEDSEFEVIDIEEDSRGGFVGAFVMKLGLPFYDKDGKIHETFNAGVSGLSQDEGAKILKNKSKYIGRMATVEYFGFSEYGIPRFPKLKAFI